MEQEKKKKGLIVLLVIIGAILLSVITLFATGNTIFKIGKAPTDTNTYEENIDIDLSLTNVTVNADDPISKILVEGNINLSYDESIYTGVMLSGYCLGSNDEKYLINGPGEGMNLFNKEDKRLTLTEDMTERIEYPDGTSTPWVDIDWKIVNIKYCKVDKMTAILNKGMHNPETELNIEKNFK